MVVVATGVNGDGHREVLSMRVATSEADPAWNESSPILSPAAWLGVRLVTGDAHTGLREAIAANLMSVTPKSMWPAVKAMLHSACDQPDAPSVNAQFDRLIEYVDGKLPDVADHLVGAREDILAFTAFPKNVWTQIWSK